LHHFEPTYLPSYNPDFNSIKRLWLPMKADRFTDWTAKSKEQLTDRLCEALNSFINNPQNNRPQHRFPEVIFGNCSNSPLLGCFVWFTIANGTQKLVRVSLDRLRPRCGCGVDQMAKHSTSIANRGYAGRPSAAFGAPLH
jgi:hypothetical protein